MKASAQDGNMSPPPLPQRPTKHASEIKRALNATRVFVRTHSFSNQLRCCKEPGNFSAKGGLQVGRQIHTLRPSTLQDAKDLTYIRRPETLHYEPNEIITTQTERKKNDMKTYMRRCIYTHTHIHTPSSCS